MFMFKNINHWYLNATKALLPVNKGTFIFSILIEIYWNIINITREYWADVQKISTNDFAFQEIYETVLHTYIRYITTSGIKRIKIRQSILISNGRLIERNLKLINFLGIHNSLINWNWIANADLFLTIYIVFDVGKFTTRLIEMENSILRKWCLEWFPRINVSIHTLHAN